MKTITMFIGLMLISTANFAQNVHTVDNRPGTTAQFSSLQAAHDAAQSGDFIYIHPSPNSYGSLQIRKEIHLRGIGHGPELANGENALVQTITLTNNTTPPTTHSSNSSFSGLNIDLIQDNGLFISTNILIRNNRIGRINFSQPFNHIIQGNVFFNTNHSQNSINFSTTPHGNNLISHNVFNVVINNGTPNVISGLIASDTVSNNLFVANVAGATNFFNNCNNPAVSNNMFVLGAAADISAINIINSTISFQNCLTFDYGGQTISPLNGSNNLDNTNPQFVDIGNPVNPIFTNTKNYKLQAGSPAINAGSDGDDLGVYAQGFLFQMKGYPFDLPYPTSINITNALVEAGGTLEVEFRAEANVED